MKSFEYVCRLNEGDAFTYIGADDVIVVDTFQVGPFNMVSINGDVYPWNMQVEKIG